MSLKSINWSTLLPILISIIALIISLISSFRNSFFMEFEHYFLGISNKIYEVDDSNVNLWPENYPFFAIEILKLTNSTNRDIDIFDISIKTIDGQELGLIDTNSFSDYDIDVDSQLVTTIEKENSNQFNSQNISSSLKSTTYHYLNLPDYSRMTLKHNSNTNVSVAFPIINNRKYTISFTYAYIPLYLKHWWCPNIFKKRKSEKFDITINDDLFKKSRSKLLKTHNSNFEYIN